MNSPEKRCFPTQTVLADARCLKMPLLTWGGLGHSDTWHSFGVERIPSRVVFALSLLGSGSNVPTQRSPSRQPFLGARRAPQRRSGPPPRSPAPLPAPNSRLSAASRGRQRRAGGGCTGTGSSPETFVTFPEAKRKSLLNDHKIYFLEDAVSRELYGACGATRVLKAMFIS